MGLETSNSEQKVSIQLQTGGRREGEDIKFCYQIALWKLYGVVFFNVGTYKGLTARVGKLF